MAIQRVLVVDDDSFSREFLTEASRSLGLHTTACKSGEEALEHARQNSVDLIFTDLRMPGMSGIELVRKVNQEHPDLPVVVVTAHGTVETPCFMPVGTLGAVKGLGPAALRDLGAEVMLSNLYHLAMRPGIELIEGLGGLHRWSGWDGPILTDSGGYQVFSLTELRKVDRELVALVVSQVNGCHY